MTSGASDRLRGLKVRLDRLRPLDPRSLEALAAWYDVELTYSSKRDRGQYADPQRDRNRPRTRHHDRRQAAQGSSRGAGPSRFAAPRSRARRCGRAGARNRHTGDPPAHPNARRSRGGRALQPTPADDRRVAPGAARAGRNSGLDGRFRRLACHRAARTRDRIRGTRSARRDPSVQRWQWPNLAAL